MTVLETTLVALLLPVAATAGKNTPHDPKQFVEYASTQYFELQSDLTYSERRGIGVRWEQGLKAGRYEARFQDKDGYYYFGGPSSLCQATPKCSAFDQDGGIWVSKKAADDVRIFIVQGAPTGALKQQVEQSGILIRALVNKDIGKIFIFPANKQFAAELAGTLHRP